MSQCQTPQTEAAHGLPSSFGATAEKQFKVLWWLIDGISRLFSLGEQSTFHCDILLQNTGFLGVKRNMVHVCQFHAGDIPRDLIIASLHVALQRKTGMFEKKCILNL
jgi:hypothetical protein